MSLKRLLPIPFVLLFSACAAIDENGTIADLRDVNIEIVDTHIDGGLEKAMKSYQKFLEQTPESAMTPEAIRRLADLNVEKEYGVINETNVDKPVKQKIVKAEKAASKSNTKTGSSKKDNEIADLKSESTKQFEKRAVAQEKIKTTKSSAVAPLPDGSNIDDLQTAGAKKAIRLYKKLLIKFPLYKHQDQVLYQLSRAYEEVGQLKSAMKVMNRLVKEYPHSRHLAEVQFRRAEYFFTRKKYLDAEDAYKAILKIGKGTEFYELTLYKQGWTFYKQDLYEDALNHFIALLDYKVSIGYDFEQSHSSSVKKRVEDTFRVISLSFSSLGGAESVIGYFKKYGAKSYESNIYSYLAEFYLTKRRYSDAASTYKAFIKNNQYHKLAPHFSMRMIEVYHKGHFPKLVIEAKKDYASSYGINESYWKYYNIKEHPKVVEFLKKNIIDLANHYHAIYQNPRYRAKKKQSFKDASHWYKQFLLSFPKDKLSPNINYLLADLYLENKDFLAAAIEYEKTAYNYPLNKKSSKAGYAAVYAYREHLKKVSQYEKNKIKREVIRSSLTFVDVFPKHDKAAVILAATADNLYEMKDYQLAIKTGHQLIKNYPKSEQSLRRSAWLVIAYSSFDILKFKESEQAYTKVLKMPGKDKSLRKKIIENLAAAVYKQGEQANTLKEYRVAANHFLRIRKLAPNSKILLTAEYDAATALIKLKDWSKAAEVLLEFRQRYPKHKYQKDITKKIAYVYREDKKHMQAAKEFERIFSESKDQTIRRESLQIAAELYQKVPDQKNTIRIYKRYVKLFPKPLEESLEIHSKIAAFYKTNNKTKQHLKTLKYIIKMDAKAGSQRTDRTRYLAGIASLEIIEPIYDELVAIKLKRPFKRNLKKKKRKMKNNLKRYNTLVDYHVGDVTAAATYYIAETYYHFSRALMESERPRKLSELELEEYNLMIEEQAYPFEEKGINIHKKNIELLSSGVYSLWIGKSLKKLGELVPGSYAKYEVSTGAVTTLMSYRYELEDVPDVSPDEINKEVIKSVEAAQSEQQNEVKESTEPAKSKQENNVEKSTQPVKSEEVKEVKKASENGVKPESN
jgi:TolA-binding protein